MKRARLVFRACRTTCDQIIEAADGCRLSIQAYEYPPTEAGGRAVWIKELDATDAVRRSWWRSDVHLIDIE